MIREKRIKFTQFIVLIAVCVYIILNISSAVFELYVYVSIKQRIAITLAILLCNALIYIFLITAIIFIGLYLVKISKQKEGDKYG